jgi:TraX protein
MNGFTLKLIAMITMLIDHTTAILVSPSHPFYMIGRSIGRLAFPIFCFLLVEGLLHTRNVKKYLLRLFIFAFDLAFYDPFNSKSYLYHQNIYFTLFIGLLVIYILSQIDKKYIYNNIKRDILRAIVIVLGCILAAFIKTDYSYIGILLICSFYLFHSQPVFMFLTLLIINALNGFPQILATLAIVFIVAYNGERGPRTNKYIFYAFYPVHLLLLFALKLLL